jgi:effector-binding domain-containing protein
MEKEPFFKQQDERRYFGIRFIAPYRGMFSRVTEEFKNLDPWIKSNRNVEFGARFLRYLVIDMKGNMELEVGVFGTGNIPLNGPITTGIMPGGRYATMIYRGLGLAANKRLLGWMKEKGLQSESTSKANSEVFACRYEAYLTDPKVEPRKKQWEIELAIKLRQ